jgi:hypothetical protein
MKGARRRVFLADAIALALPPERLSDLFDLVQAERAAGIRPLLDDELDAQMRRLKAGIPSGPDGRPKVALYDIRDFVY